MELKKKTHGRRSKRKRILFVEESEIGIWTVTHFIAFILAALVLIYLIIQYLF